MKRLFLVIATAVYIAYPFWAANSLAEAIEDGDEAALRRAVDWELVRIGLNEDLRGTLSREGGVVASALGGIVLAPLVDALVTPEGLAAMIRQGGQVRAEELRESVSWAFFSSPTSFDIVLQGDDDRRIVAEMQLQGLRWRLVRIRFDGVS